MGIFIYTYIYIYIRHGKFFYSNINFEYDGEWIDDQPDCIYIFILLYI